MLTSNGYTRFVDFRRYFDNVMIKLATIALFIVGWSFFPLHHALGKMLNISELLEKSVENSLEVRLSDLDRAASRQRIKEAESGYFPTLDFQLNGEYSKNLADDGNVSSVGDTIITDDSKFQNSASFSLLYNLSGFLIASKEVGMRQNEADANDVLRKKRIRDIKLEVFGHFEKAFEALSSIKKIDQISALYSERKEILQRLQKSGQAARTELVEVSMRLSRFKADKGTLLLDIRHAMDELSYYTGEVYDSGDLELAGPRPHPFELSKSLNISNALEYMTAMLQLSAKNREIEIDNLRLWPTVQLYSKYNFFGEDDNSIAGAVDNAEQREISVGISIGVNIFDGMQYSARRERLHLEKERIRGERDLQMKQLQRSYQSLLASIEAAAEDAKIKQELIDDVREQSEMVDRLIANGLIGPLEALDQKEALTDHLFDLESALARNRFNIARSLILLGEDKDADGSYLF